MQSIRQKLKVSNFLLIVLLGSPLAHGALNKTYPTSATTNLRVETYVDAVGTIYKSTYSVQVSTWFPIGSTWTYILSDQKINGVEWYIKTATTPINPLNGIKLTSSNGLINGYSWVLENSTYVVKSTTWTVGEYSNLIINEAKRNFINEVLDGDIEQYMVWGDTTTLPVKGTWKGWCLSYINKKPVPIACP